MADPSDLPFVDESLEDAGRRVAEVAERCWRERSSGGHVVVVGHQDPIESARRLLTGRDLADFNAAKPAHASVITLGQSFFGKPIKFTIAPGFNPSWYRRVGQPIELAE